MDIQVLFGSDLSYLEFVTPDDVACAIWHSRMPCGAGDGFFGTIYDLLMAGF